MILHHSHVIGFLGAIFIFGFGSWLEDRRATKRGWTKEYCQDGYTKYIPPPGGDDEWRYKAICFLILQITLMILWVEWWA